MMPWGTSATHYPRRAGGTNELLSVGYYIRNNSDWPDEIYTSFSNGHEQINVYQDSTPAIGSAMIPT